MKRAVALVALALLVSPAAASAHATLLRTSPANGDVLATSPRLVRVVFDDTVRRTSGNEAIDNATRKSVLAARPSIEGDALLIPLRQHLADGDYSVRWSVVSDDGHREEGVLAFAVGAGRSAPRSVLGASTPLGWNDILLRTLYYFGLLCGAGTCAFVLLSRRILGRRSTRVVSHVLFSSALAVFLGGSAIIHSAPPGTRFALVLKVVVTLALVTGAAAALAPMYERLLLVAAAGSVAMLAGPTLSGHALDRDQPVLLSVPTDLAHIAGSAVWLGGLVSLVVVLPRATADDAERRAVVRRFSTVAFISVVVLAVSGLLRALTELGSVSQIWSSGYGRALIVKTALFFPLLGIGWLNRTMLLGAFARLRRSAIVEVTLILGIVVAVAVLTELRPGTAASRVAEARAPLQAAGPATLPPRDA
ncbi:MAG: copper resistance protein CopC/CopD, partial [Actinobacteria bacterium]|nr:copper resistance protein CopC/CopD [Actinomycetota bacterium]